ncbi:RNA-guided endonuclease InsQ/TnpB family protein [Halobacterium noricense]|uniref:RNA-guided endonuclease InsQ/TnpB family protein n=1 Tax=Halobacterium noricense TaxID=223182 RepID=UPI001E3B814B|nr:transposase [Halobacterium noricense]UHH26515.1 transposase [Halobacterium noricense]
MEYRRTAVIKLDTPEGADIHLRETVEQFKYCANTASEWCWHGDDGYHVTSKAKAEGALYDQLREDTELTANLVQKGIRQAVESVKSGVERLKNDQDTSRPTFTADTAVYDKRSATFHRDHVSLSTPDGRIECDYILPDDTETPPTKYVANEDYEFRRATLHRRDGDWYLHASMLKEDDDTDSTTEHRTVLGVDLGVNQLAVASTGRFWSADEFTHWKREYEKRRGDLQQCGTRAAHDAIAGVERKEDGRFEIFLHRVANEIVAEARSQDCSHIVFEDLTDIRESVPQASWHHLWAFRRLYECVAYKAKEQGVKAVQVDPRNTSKRCSTCGFTHDDNRDGEDFQCQNCGYQNHADYNASKNIGLQYLRRRQNADDGGSPVDVRLNRGTLNVSGEYNLPASSEA